MTFKWPTKNLVKHHLMCCVYLKSALNTSYQTSRQKRWYRQQHKAIRHRVQFLQLRLCGSNASEDGKLAAELINQLLIKAEIELNPGPLKCNCFKKLLGKSTKKTPTVWCHVCGWVHFKCSGLNTHRIMKPLPIFGVRGVPPTLDLQTKDQTLHIYYCTNSTLQQAVRLLLARGKF